MITYSPIDCGATWNCDRADLRFVDWRFGTFEWQVEDEPGQKIAVQFSGDIIVRILDEFALSTESSSGEWVGLVPHHFAYEVKGDAFFQMQSEAWRLANAWAKHYRFMTGAACVDVIASKPPSFQIS